MERRINERRINDWFTVRAIPVYVAGSDFELVGYKPVIVKTIDGRVSPPNIQMSKMVQGIFRDNVYKSVICGVIDGFLVEWSDRVYVTPKAALEASGL